MRYFKYKVDGSSKFSTRLVAKNGVYGRREGSSEGNAFLLVKAGLVEHKNCIPYLPKQAANRRSKPNSVLHRGEILEVQLPCVEKVTEDTKIELTQKLCGEEAMRISEMKSQIGKEMRPKREKLEELRQLFPNFLQQENCTAKKSSKENV